MHWETVIGLDVHAQLSTSSKIFSGASTAFGAEPNTQADAVSIALPGISIPCGFVNNAMPVGLQIIGDYFSEARMLNVAHQYQLATDWHSRAPQGI